ncbi:MAG: hypothetical protein AB7H97_08260 [Pseudobdellovibrionaceae bacterium]
MAFPTPDKSHLDARQIRLTRAVGNCIMAWGGIELHLALTFEKLLASPPYVANTVWDSVVSFDAKMKALNSVMELRISDPELRAIWKKLLKKIQKKAGKRNEIAHCTLVIKDNEDATIVPYYSFAKDRPYLKAEDLEARWLTFNDYKEATRWLLAAVMVELSGGRRPEHMPVPEVIRRIQESIEQERATSQSAPNAVGGS